ncbi:MAG: IclR family transcriptional regulator [Leucobacter sp.]|nr:IclR family transcriptional regulator [Leucobacter sp.]
MPRSNEPGRTVASRLVEILFSFTPNRREMSLAELSRVTGLPHPTVRRLALELVDAGLLERNEAGSFTVGLKLWRLATLAPNTESLRAVANPFMEDLFTAVNQHVQLVVLEQHDAVVIDRRSGTRGLELASQVGGRLPLHASAGGKVLLAHSSEEFIEDYLAHKLARYTASTVTDPAVLRRELADCRRFGVATVRGELTRNLDSAAARIIGQDGRVQAAISVILRAGVVQLPVIQPSVHASGLGISRLLGWSPDTPIRRD